MKTGVKNMNLLKSVLRRKKQPKLTDSVACHACGAPIEDKVMIFGGMTDSEETLCKTCDVWFIRNFFLFLRDTTVHFFYYNLYF